MFHAKNLLLKCKILQTLELKKSNPYTSPNQVTKPKPQKKSIIPSNLTGSTENRHSNSSNQIKEPRQALNT